MVEKSKWGIFRQGLWKKSWHPNLFFELMIWSGFSLAGFWGLSSIGTFATPIMLFLLVDWVTVPITERVMSKRWDSDEWKRYISETNKYFLF